MSVRGTPPSIAAESGRVAREEPELQFLARDPAASGRPAGALELMIEALKSDEIVNRVGGRFKLCSLIQRRLVQLMEGGRPLVERNGRSDLELVIEEIVQGKITYEFDPNSGIDIKKILPDAR